ncbi:MAG: carbon-nitrogen hydrolase family protein [Pseudomonadales bacterium]|nr:carbon-nitrogen hydrolase family protein [Pseudomonadales bacterium]
MTRIALIQMVSSQQQHQSLERASELIHSVPDDVEAIFLPENFSALAAADPRQLGEAESRPDGPVQRFLAATSRESGKWIFGGTVPHASRPDGTPVPDQRVRAASLVYTSAGELICRYDKIHMFDVDVSDATANYRESTTFEPGEDLQVTDSPLGPIGLSVCYDIRFPELYRALALRGATSFTIPSAFTRVTGKAHFELLMRARAVENLCYTIAACQGGTHDSGRETWGHSMVVSPWGEVLAQAGEGEAVICADIDLQEVERRRSQMPVHRQRRL